MPAGHSLGGSGTQLESHRLQGQPVATGDFGYARRHRRALRMDPVIHVGHDQGQLAGAGGVDQEVEQGQRMGAAGDRHQRLPRWEGESV